ncbi:MAG: 23S rRNA (guanosine(2251)-2'-O)-methyltransferase RlmB [Acholeplasmatales bacterium]|jgi:predicted rRNA methylase|nr:23S rRNA (guanosine(2251)-2'-O)-methyltransferase RlmB [Acholeplasmatales bacterium]
MLISGKNALRAAIFNLRPIYNVYILSGFTDKEFIKLLDDKKIKYKFVDKEEIYKIYGDKNNQGIVSEVLDYEYSDIHDILSKESSKLVILDELSDPHNLGSIIRTADAFKYDGIIFQDNNQVSLNKTVVRVSAGSIERVKIFKVTNINQTILLLKKNDYFIVGTALEATTNFDKFDYPIKTAVVMGSEGFGLRHLVKRNCDLLVKIPMSNTLNSLNVSVASGLIMYEINKNNI